MKQLSAQDAQFLYMENDRNLSNVAMACIYAPPTRQVSASLFERLRSHVGSRLHSSPIFRRKLIRVPLELDFPYWADDEFFDLEGHLHSHRLTGGDRWKAFCELMGRIYSRPMDMNRPLWEMHLVEGIGGMRDFPEDSFAVITKLHHAAVDGAATMRFFGCLSDRDAKGTPAWDISGETEHAGEAPTSEDIWKQFLRNRVSSPLRMTRSLLRAAALVAPGMRGTLIHRKDGEKDSVPATRFNRRLAPVKNFDAAEFSLDDFKLVQRAVEGAKINDVVLAVCSGALRSYLARHGELPAGSLVGWVPVNTRDAGAAADGREGNQVTAMTIDLCTRIDDPIERLQKITGETTLAKEGKSGLFVRVISEISGSMPSTALALVSRALASSGASANLCNVAVSNVPGPQTLMYLDGARCLQQFGMTPLADGMGLFVIALSYNGRISLSLVSTRDVVPDMPVLRGCMEVSVAELVRAAKKRNTPRGAAPRRRKSRS